MSPYTPGEQPAPGTRVVKLNTNEAPFPPSAKVMAALRDVAPERLRIYPDPTARSFRETAAKLHGVEPENVLAGNGSDDVLTILTRTFVPPGGKVVSPWPTYSLYPTLCDIEGAGFVEVPWEAGWKLPTKALLAEKADAIYLANPNAPSGTFVEPDELAALAKKFRGVVLIDEAYADFASDSCIRLLAGHENIVVSRTLSKGYALAGLRFGYCLAHAATIAQMGKVKDSYNTDVLSQIAATAALEDQEHAGRIWQHVREERSRLMLELQLLGFSMPESHTNFILAGHPGYPDAGELYAGLKAQGILVRYWNKPGLSDKLRITVGTSQENNALLAALQELVGSGSASTSPLPAC